MSSAGRDSIFSKRTAISGGRSILTENSNKEREKAVFQNPMKLYLTGSTDRYYNLAAEEYYLRESEEDVFMLWQNEPTVVIGRNQNMYAEVDLAFTEERGIHVARRITGGGAVYHDLGNICYTFITSREKANVLDFAYFSAPVLKALEALGINAKLSGRNDLLAESEPGVFGVQLTGRTLFLFYNKEDSS